jgi:hypothetical protein
MIRLPTRRITMIALACEKMHVDIINVGKMFTQDESSSATPCGSGGQIFQIGGVKWKPKQQGKR